MNQNLTSKWNHVVYGNGWSATFAVALSRKLGKSVLWIQGSSASFKFPMPHLSAEPGAEDAIRILSELLDEEITWESGLFSREFKKSSFRHPLWYGDQNRAQKKEIRLATLHPGEENLICEEEVKLSRSLQDYYEKILQKIHLDEEIGKIENTPIQKIAKNTLWLANGQEIEFDQMFYAETLQTLSIFEGVDKTKSISKFRPDLGALQLHFEHHHALGHECEDGFFHQIHKDSKQEQDRHVMGCFYDQGKKSVWTLLLKPEECEDHHEISKKIRRMKQAIQRMFSKEAGLIAYEEKDFMDTVKAEQVRFQEAVFCEHSSVHPFSIPAYPEVVFLQDGHSSSSIFNQLKNAFQDSFPFWTEKTNLEVERDAFEDHSKTLMV